MFIQIKAKELPNSRFDPPIGMTPPFGAVPLEIKKLLKICRTYYCIDIKYYLLGLFLKYYILTLVLLFSIYCLPISII